MLDELWKSAPSATGVLKNPKLITIPEPARRYLQHAIAHVTPLASAVRLKMHGEIEVGRWLPFTAEQVIHAERGFVWKATAHLAGVPVLRGFDRLVADKGEMRWHLFGVIPIIFASGPGITRSAAGRMQAESMWLPSVFVHAATTWNASDSRHATIMFGARPDAHPIEFEIDETGRLHELRMRRWGNPGGGPFRFENFGVVMAAERTFGGYTIPSQIRGGWYFGSPRFDSDGEFFRATITTRLTAEGEHRPTLLLVAAAVIRAMH
jgi:uncharacterized protein DUF6544